MVRKKVVEKYLRGDHLNKEDNGLQLMAKTNKVN